MCKAGKYMQTRGNLDGAEVGVRFCIKQVGEIKL